ncbi:MAG: hypothetical protein HDS35_12080 [Bacteroides sp.]|nr:hypothetical protein [Bacteroides sp.]
MRGALIIFIAMVAIGIVLYLIDLLYYRKKKGLPPVNLTTKPSSSTADSATNPTTSDTSASSGVRSGAVATESPATESAPDSNEPEVCCGMHMVCEKTNLSPLSADIIYYDDEELDRFRGRDPKTYTPEETEEFRDVLMTLLPQDVAGWSRSIQLREISLPLDVRDELLLIVSELRQTSS